MRTDRSKSDKGRSVRIQTIRSSPEAVGAGALETEKEGAGRLAVRRTVNFFCLAVARDLYRR